MGYRSLDGRRPLSNPTIKVGGRGVGGGSGFYFFRSTRLPRLWPGNRTTGSGPTKCMGHLFFVLVVIAGREGREEGKKK